MRQEKDKIIHKTTELNFTDKATKTKNKLDSYIMQLVVYVQ